MERVKTFRVGTFYDRSTSKMPKKSRIDAYIWYSNRWKDCVEFMIEAKTGTEAKKKAVAARLEQEMEHWLKTYNT